MPRTSYVPRSASAVFALLLIGACAPARGGLPTGAMPAPEREELGEGPVIEEIVVRRAVRDILGEVEYDLPLEANSWVEAELDFLVGQRSAVIGRWLERGDPYQEWIKQVLGSYRVPTDLYHLAAIESGFVPTVRSRAGAVGMWQFMPATGRQMGLRVDTLLDERMDPIRSTHAAARHLRSLHQIHKDWALAAAAYNAGSGRISRGLQAVGATNFWDLAQRGDLAEETRQYVPRLYAVTVIGRNRERFGFAPPATAESFAYDSIHVEYATPLAELASLGNVPIERLTQLNPHLLRGTTPAGGYWVWVPSGAGPQLQRSYLASDFRKQQGTGSYTVRWGDSLGKLAQSSGVKPARIREMNPEVDFDKLRTGQKLRLPYQAAETLASRPIETAPAAPVRVASTPAAAAPSAPLPASSSSTNEQGPVDSAYATHVVQSGETLWGIARRYGTSVDALQSANELGERPIRPGQKLTVPR